MRKFLGTFAIAIAVAAIAASASQAMRIAFRPPAQRAASAETLLVGKVTSIAKDEVEATAPFNGATNKVKYKIATVKIIDGLTGTKGMTEIKVGFIPPPPPPVVNPNPNPNPNGPVLVRPPIRRPGNQSPQLKEGDELLLFLAKHPTADFYVMPGMSPPLAIADENGKKQLEAVKKVVATLADPMKGLKHDKPEVRAETAATMIAKYRAFPDLGGEVTQVAINADESKLILKSLAEADWSNAIRIGVLPGSNPIQAFYSLQLNEKDGWIAPVIVNTPGAPPVDFNAVQKDAFTQWLAGAGKNYVIKKNVPKAKPMEK